MPAVRVRSSAIKFRLNFLTVLLAAASLATPLTASAQAAKNTTIAIGAVGGTGHISTYTWSTGGDLTKALT